MTINIFRFAIVLTWKKTCAMYRNNGFHVVDFGFVKFMWSRPSFPVNKYEWIKKDRPAWQYPIGTKARVSWEGGYWIKTQLGWKWFNGDTFPIPGCADEVMLPQEGRIVK